jgi:hypothetical protein
MCIIAKKIAKTNKWMRVAVLTLLTMESLSEGSLPLNNMQVISCALRSSPFREVLKLLLIYLFFPSRHVVLLFCFVLTYKIQSTSMPENAWQTKFPVFLPIKSVLCRFILPSKDATRSFTLMLGSTAPGEEVKEDEGAAGQVEEEGDVDAFELCV